jgi:heme exporter protein B
MGPAALEIVVTMKGLAHWLATGLPLAIAAPLLGFLLNLDPGQIVPLVVAMGLGSVALSLLASLGAAVTVGIRRGGLLVSLIILPLYVPVVIFGVAASAGAGAIDIATPSLLILAAIALVALVTVPFAAAAALRAYMH